MAMSMAAAARLDEEKVARAEAIAEEAHKRHLQHRASREVADMAHVDDMYGGRRPGSAAFKVINRDQVGFQGFTLRFRVKLGYT